MSRSADKTESKGCIVGLPILYSLKKYQHIKIFKDIADVNLKAVLEYIQTNQD